MQQLHRVSPCPQSPAFHVPSNLYTCTHVFVCHDAVRKPLGLPYDGPYKVLRRQATYIVLDINKHQNTITIDRLKPAFLEFHLLPAQSVIPSESSSAPQQYEQLTRTTRSGRRVHFPDLYGTM